MNVPELTVKTDVQQLLQDLGKILGKDVNFPACSGAIDMLVTLNLELFEDSRETQIDAIEFVEMRGVLWKSESDGAVSVDPYCPKCKLVMTSTPSGNMPCVCTICHFTTPFTKKEIPGIRNQLNSM